MSNNKGGPAFPMQYEDGAWQLGMTLRDYFAAKAMQELVGTKIEKELATKESYAWADAMLKAREA